MFIYFCPQFISETQIFQSLVQPLLLFLSNSRNHPDNQQEAGRFPPLLQWGRSFTHSNPKGILRQAGKHAAAADSNARSAEKFVGSW